MEGTKRIPPKAGKVRIARDPEFELNLQIISLFQFQIFKLISLFILKLKSSESKKTPLKNILIFSSTDFSIKN